MWFDCFTSTFRFSSWVLVWIPDLSEWTQTIAIFFGNIILSRNFVRTLRFDLHEKIIKKYIVWVIQVLFTWNIFLKYFFFYFLRFWMILVNSYSSNYLIFVQEYNWNDWIICYCELEKSVSAAYYFIAFFTTI